MKTVENISQELTSIGCVHLIHTKHPYTVPSSYFKNNASLLYDKSILGLPTNTNVYHIPTNYFQQSATAILNKIAVDVELQGIAPMLASIPKNNTLSAPSGYFKTLSIATNNKQQSKVIGMQWTLKKMVIAAAFIAVAFLGSIWFMQQPSNYTEVPVALSEVSETEMIQYLANDYTSLASEVAVMEEVEKENKATKQPLPELTEEQLNNFLNTHTTGDNKEG